MESNGGSGLNIATYIAGDVVRQDITIGGDLIKRAIAVADKYMDAKLREALIFAGWTPPGQKASPAPAPEPLPDLPSGTAMAAAIAANATGAGGPYTLEVVPCPTREEAIAHFTRCVAHKDFSRELPQVCHNGVVVAMTGTGPLGMMNAFRIMSLLNANEQRQS